MIINRSQFVEYLKLMMPTVSKATTVTGNQCIASDGIKLYSYNNYTGYEIPFAFPVCSFVPTKVQKVLSAWAHDDISVDIDGSNLKFKANGSSLTVPVLDSNIIQSVNNLLVIDGVYRDAPKDLIDAMLGGVIKGNSSNTSKVPGIVVSGCDVLSTDGNVIYYAKVNANLDTFRLPEKYLGLLSRHTVESIAIMSAMIVCKIECGTLLLRRWDMNSYPIDSVKKFVSTYIDATNNYVVELDKTSEVAESLAQALVVSGADNYIQIEFKPIGVRVYSESADGSYDNVLDIQFGTDENLTLQVNPNTFIPLIKKHKELKIIREGDKAMCIFKSGEKYNVLRVRLE